MGNARRGILDVWNLHSDDSMRIKVIVHLEGDGHSFNFSKGSKPMKSGYGGSVLLSSVMWLG